MTETPKLPTDDQPTVAESRSCANCACFGYAQPDGSVVRVLHPVPPVGVCRRDPPIPVEAEQQVPLMHKGEPMKDARGGIRMQTQRVRILTYSPAMPQAVCYDGWRPIDSLPGQQLRTWRGN